ncbi:Transcriptional regulatory protein, C terminal [Actinacidiphila rubida]|uniref:Transcriptional regulatory protein, C terminal n=1 Tax=Actinacidiphila rubida TaxID=310780 RepID=A0A1H8NTY7_9ACTN|nr:winged helix-turn-helix domain-containing protein [Actinacidiphila rubida]SEO33110.1 Transcriptional regulatory protein, C terminal [Actinacidiphila rubida]
MSNVTSIPPLTAPAGPPRPSRPAGSAGPHASAPGALTAPGQAAARPHLRAVRGDEAPPAPDFLPPGATWMPAPGHVLAAVAGGTPMVGYLVLVPAEPGAAASAGPPPAPDDASPLRVDTERRIAEVDGRPLELTYLEFELLAHLVAHPHRVHTRDQLVTTVWGYGHIGDGRTVDVHVARLRRKLGAEHRGSIVTVRRVGYKYAPAPAAG